MACEGRRAVRWLRTRDARLPLPDSEDACDGLHYQQASARALGISTFTREVA